MDHWFRAAWPRQGHPNQPSRTIHDLLDQDWVVNYPDDNHENFMGELFGSSLTHLNF
jgi:hypothetical protein